MGHQSPSSQAHDVGAAKLESRCTAIRIVTAIAAILALAVVVVGIAMAANRHEVPCPDGHEFPAGTTDFRCFSYPQAGEGISLAMLAVVLGIIVVLCGVIATTTLTSRAGSVGAPEQANPS
jgi:hypothetical protein